MKQKLFSGDEHDVVGRIRRTYKYLQFTNFTEGARAGAGPFADHAAQPGQMPASLVFVGHGCPAPDGLDPAETVQSSLLAPACRR
ncbi:hypothetical protein [Micromonospora cremea]|uniref:hypothetical protein n=1 Tax=Micromonospora cremea TaxID=709881 RepID=UPI00094132AB|nr:hypothetical protein [Micromonospora cremea]